MNRNFHVSPRVGVVTCLIVLVGWVQTTAVFSQKTQQGPPPSPPYITAPPLPVAWSVTVEKKVSSTPAPLPIGKSTTVNPGFVRKYQYAQSADLRQENLTYDNGLTSERWFYGESLFFTMPGSTLVRTFPRYPQPGAPFSEFSWIDLSNYKGTEVKRGKLCYIYESQVSGGYASPDLQKQSQAQAALAQKYGKVPSTNAKAMGLKAWIEVATKLPVELDDESQNQSYAMLPAPSNLMMPANFGSALKIYQDLLAAPEQRKVKF